MTREAVLDVSIFEEAVLENNVVTELPGEHRLYLSWRHRCRTSRKGPTIDPLDAQGCYRRWLGLGLFCGTVVVTLLLRRVASHPGADELPRCGVIWELKKASMSCWERDGR
jgi:hypothetical protein